MPPPREPSQPIVDDLTTLPAGMKVSVSRTGDVRVVKDSDYKRTVLDGPEPKLKKKNPTKTQEKTKKVFKVLKSKKKSKKGSDEDEDDDLSEMEEDEEFFDAVDEAELSEVEETIDNTVNVKEVKPATKRPATTATATADDDSSDDEVGQALEDGYMEELALLEDEQTPPVAEVDQQPPVAKGKAKAKAKKIPAVKKTNLNKKAKIN